MDVQEKQHEDLIDEEVADISTVSDDPLEISQEAQQSEEELEKIAPVDSSQVLKTKSPSKKILIAVLFIAINLLAILTTVVMEFTGKEQPVPLSAVWNTFMQNIGWGICGILMFVCAILCDTFKRNTLLKSTLNKNMMLTSFKSTIICRYYDYITPLGSGGQPFEIYYLRKKGIPVGIASGIPIVSYALDRIAYVCIALTTILIYGFGEITTFLKVLCIIGLLANAFIPFAIFFFTVMPKVANSVSNFVAKVAFKLHIVKDKEAFEHKITGSINEYATCLKYFMHKSKISMLKGFLSSCLQFFALYSIPFFAVRMSGNYSATWGEMFALCVICYTSVTLLPTPGNSGGAELSFRSIFASYLSGGLLFWGMLSWRILSYYSYIIAGIIMILGQQIKKIIVFKRHPEKAKQQDQPLVHEPPKRSEVAVNSNADDELTYFVPKKAIVETEDIQFAEPIIQAEATIEDSVLDEKQEVNLPDDAEMVFDIELVIDKTSKTMVIEPGKTLSANGEIIATAEPEKQLQNEQESKPYSEEQKGDDSPEEQEVESKSEERECEPESLTSDKKQ